jgi:hypothetical protein
VAQEDVVVHWRTLRERLEGTIRHIESDLRAPRWQVLADVGGRDLEAERRYERLLRWRRLHAKVSVRERIAESEKPLVAKRGEARQSRTS